MPGYLRAASVLAILLSTVWVFGACTGPGAPVASSLSVDGSRRFQRIDGFGVNANPKNWNFSDLTPAIDRLVDDMHASIWRVDVYGESNWIDTPAHLTPSYYSIIYESPDFQALWRTLAYLNAKGVRTILSASGLVPDWMGGTVINPANEDQFVEMITSVIDYGRRVKGIPITMLSPLNETDLGPPEGPSVGPAQYARLMNKLIVRLQASGYSDVQLITPDVSGVVNAPSFFDAMTSDPATMAHIQHVGVHDYAGSAGGMDGYVKATTYPDRNLWLTEWSQNATDGWLDNGRAVADEWRFASVMTDALLSLLKGNAAAVLAWDAWDNVHEHCGCSSISRWGQLALDSTAQTYRPKKRFFTNAHVFNFVPPGWVRIDANASEPGVRVVAFTDAASGQVTIVGHNTTATTAALSASLAGLAPIPTLRWYETNASENLVRKPDITVGGTGFNVNVAANSFFTFTTLGSDATPHV